MKIFRTINGRVVPIEVPYETKSASTKIPKIKGCEPSLLSKDYYQTKDSFTVPNVHCPVCSAAVYYYEHQNGAKVYFDVLGPPWTKHPCTTNFKTKPTFIKKTTIAHSYSNSWESAGWEPYFINKVIVKPEPSGLGKGVVLTIASKGKVAEFAVSYTKLRKMRVNPKNIKRLLIQGKSHNQKLNLEVHDGVRVNHFSTMLRPVISKEKRLLLCDVELELPNSDGYKAFLSGTSNGKEFFSVIDLKVKAHATFVEELTTKRLKLALVSKSKYESRWFEQEFDIYNNDVKLLTLKNIRKSKRQQHLSPSQMAQIISENKQKRGGNSSFADAFQIAFKKT